MKMSLILVATKIFPCTRDDIRGLLRLDRRCFVSGEAFDADMIKEAFDLGVKIFRVEVDGYKYAAAFYLEQDHVIEGTSAWRISMTKMEEVLEDQTHVMSIGVDPKYQGRGMGNVIMKRILRYKRPIFLEVRSSNKPAVHLYTKYGFVRIGRLRNYYPDGSDAYRMRLV